MQCLSVGLSLVVSHQLAELHDQEIGGGLTALAQALQDIWMLEASGNQKHNKHHGNQTTHIIG